MKYRKLKHFLHLYAVEDQTKKIIANDIKNVIESEEYLRLMIDSTAEGIYAIDMKGECTMCNQTAVKMLGYLDESELTGKNMHSLIHHTHTNGTYFKEKDCLIYKAFKTGKGSNSPEDILWRKDGSSFPAEIWSYPIQKGNSILGAVVTFLDITKRKETENELIALKNELERKVEEKTQELQERIRELERFHDATIHRELRIKELRDELANLKAK